MTNVFVKCKIQQIGNVITNSNYPPGRNGFSIGMLHFQIGTYFGSVVCAVDLDSDE